MAKRGGRRDDSRSLSRRGPVRDPLPLILVVCEGKVTEPRYVEEFRLAHGATTVRVKVVSPGGDPLALVEKAIELRENSVREARRAGDDNLRYDEAWCVFDVDDHQRLKEARRRAEAKGIRLSVSNPCFELWLILHFTDHSAHMTSQQASRKLSKHLPQYDKHIRYDELAAGYTDAVSRARRLDQHHADLGKDGGNPSTGMHRLTERIREFGKTARLSTR